MLAAQKIQHDHAAMFTWLSGDLQRVATECRAPADADRDSLVFVGDADQLACAVQRTPAIVIVQAKLAASATAALGGGASCCFSVRNVPAGMALLLKYFDRKRVRFEQWGVRHPTAVVHAEATIGQGVLLGPYCVIGAGAKIGDGCLIGALAVIENGARIGAATIIHPHVFIGAGCEVGERCEIHPHTSVGSDGFGYAVDPDGRPRKISHLGNVQIGDEAYLNVHPLRRQGRQYLSHRPQLRPGRERILHRRFHDGRIDQDRAPVCHGRKFGRDCPRHGHR